MDVRQYIRPDMTVSAIVHLSLVAFFMFSEMRPLHPVTEETIPVEVVVEEKKPDTQPFQPLPELPKPELPKPETPSLPSTNASSAQSAASQPQSPASRTTRRETQPQPQQQSQPPQPQAQSQPQPQSQAAAPTPSASASTPGYSQPEPDITVKYGVMLGLPGDVPVASPSSAGSKHGEGDTDLASDKLGSTLIEVLRRHLKSCSKLPAGLSPSDNVAVKLRVQLAPNGRLAAEPALIEGTASMKGVQLMQGAIAALSACQPYAMLPADRYGEWKVLDLSFTPHDFNS
jgi:hypothetical protein